MSLSGLGEVNQKVISGEITGIVTWPLEGVCTVEGIGEIVKKGKSFLEFTMKNNFGKTSFLVNIPTSASDPRAMFMGMQTIYATLYSVAACSPKTVSPIQALALAKKKLPVVAEFKLRNYESFDPNKGVKYTNQNLVSLVVKPSSVDAFSDASGDFA